jgi:hypothetical protein
MTETRLSTVVAYLARNLDYKLTYLEIYQEYLEQVGEKEVIEFIQALMDAEQESIARLSSRLRQLGHPVRQQASLEKLKAQAFTRRDTPGKLQFVQAGLERSAAWYAEQLLNREMVADWDTRQLLIELGRTEAAYLWHANALLAEMAVAEDVHPTRRPVISSTREGHRHSRRGQSSRRRPDRSR